MDSISNKSMLHYSMWNFILKKYYFVKMKFECKKYEKGGKSAGINH